MPNDKTISIARPLPATSEDKAFVIPNDPEEAATFLNAAFDDGWRYVADVTSMGAGPGRVVILARAAEPSD